MACIFAIDDFTVENGATVIYKGSHKWEAGRIPEDTDVPDRAVMKSGSVVLYVGTVFHSGGPNLSKDKKRLGVTAQVEFLSTMLYVLY